MVMESWSYVSGGKGFVSSETISSSDTFTRNKNALLGWDLKIPCNFVNNGLVLGQQAMDSRGFGELGYSELIGDELPDNSIRDGLSGKAESGKLSTPFMVSANSFGLEDDSTSRLSSSIVDSNCRDSCFIDLKLGRFGDPRDSVSSKGTPIVSSSDSSTPLKRIRVGMNSHTAYCQVYGCSKDLSSSKEYHKRHKVCEVHSKTAKVIVNGIEQRFCQQCSRFHLLNEFDDGKRSCRKRLQGHNERRRKPQVAIHSGRAGKIIQPYNGFAGGKFHGTALSSSSFICQDILPSGLLHPAKYGACDWSRRVKLEDGTSFDPLSAIPITGSIYNESINRHPNAVGGPNSCARPLFQNSSLGNENFTAFEAASNIQGLSGITYSGCALSLLSPQSSNSSSHSSGIPVACPLLLPRNNSRYSMSQVSEKLIGASPQASSSGVSNKIVSSVMSSVEAGHLGSIMIPDGSDAITFNVDAVYHGSHLTNPKDRLSSEDGTTINLLQLSSELQRVEHQKQSMQVKQENDAFCWPHSS